MSSINCHRCTRLMAAALPICPHCGASQDPAARATSARRNLDTLLAVLPPIGGAIGGWFVFAAQWGIFVGLGVGLVIGVGLVALRQVLRPNA